MSPLELHAYGLEIQNDWIGKYIESTSSQWPKCKRGRSFKPRLKAKSIIIAPGTEVGDDLEGDLEDLENEENETVVNNDQYLNNLNISSIDEL